MRILLLLVGVFACSTSVIFIKMSHVPVAYLASLRMLLGCLILLPVFFYSVRRSGEKYTFRTLRRSLLPAVMLSIHMISWTIGARLTEAANGTLIVNLSPLAMPFVMYFMIGERITRMEIVGTLIAMGGVFVLGASDYQFGAQTIRGDIICLVSMVVCTLYLAFARRNCGELNLWVYVVPMYGLSGLLSAGAAIVLHGLPELYPFKEWGYLLGLALLPTVIGHSLLNWAMRHLRGQTVMILNLGQFVFVAVMAYYQFGQAPRGHFYIASALVISGAVIVIVAAGKLGAGLALRATAPVELPPALSTCAGGWPASDRH